jgi:GT2 family glycosyltransferase
MPCKTTSVPDEPFSIIIPSWNGVGLLPDCLDSLRAQTFQGFETIVVDNASTDGTVSLIQQDYPEVRLVTLPTNRGFAGAVNVGISQSSGPLVALINQDVEAHPAWLEALLSAAEAHPTAGAFACKIMLFDRRDCFHSAGDAFRRDGIPVNRGVWQTDTGQFDDHTKVFGACGGAAVYRSTMLDQVGGLDERFFMYCEDVDLAWRHQLAGFRAVFVPNSVVYHRLSASGGGVTASYYTGRNTIYVMVKNVPGALLWKNLPAIAAAQWRIARQAIGSWRGEAARARLRGQLAGLVTWPRLLPSRRAIQRSRRVSIPYLESLLQPID